MKETIPLQLKYAKCRHGLINKYDHVAGLSLFYRHYFGKCSSELAELVPLPYSRGRSTRYSGRLHDLKNALTRLWSFFNIYMKGLKQEGFKHTRNTKVFKNGPSKICGRQPLKNLILSILEYLDPYFALAVLSARRT